MIFYTGLNTQSLFVVPYKDELLSSWLLRMVINANSYGTEFYNSLGAYKDVWYRDIDRQVPLDFYEFIQKNTPYSVEEVKSLSLTSFDGKIYEQDNPNGANKWIRQLSFRGRIPTSFYLLYCPLCLSTNTPYYKKIWRIKFVNICTKCGIYLRNSCPHCMQPIHFFRNGVGKNRKMDVKLTDCFNCGKNICETPFADAPSRLVDSSIKLINISEEGHHAIFNYSFIYFDSLYQVYKILSSHFSLTKNIEPLISSKLIHLSHWLLEDFPENIILISRNRKISKSFWLKDFYMDRFYFKDQITKHLSKLKLTQFD